MSRIKAENVATLKERNRKKQSEVWPLENDNFYIRLAEDTFGAGVRDNTRAEKIEIGKAVDCGTLTND